MPLFFSSAVSAALAGEVPGLAFLVELEFAEGTRRLFNGDGTIVAGGREWQGIGALGSVSDITAGEGDAARPVTLTLSGVDEQIAALAASGGATIRGRRASISLQMISADTMQMIDDPVVVWTGKMDRLSYASSVEDDRVVRSVTLVCEGPFTARSKTPAGMLTDRDQQARWPGDRICEYVAANINKKIEWP